VVGRVLQPLDPEPAGADPADPTHSDLAGTADPDGRTARLDRAQVGMDRRQGEELPVITATLTGPSLAFQRKRCNDHRLDNEPSSVSLASLNPSIAARQP
jgi:hypothetical protein